MEIQLHPPFHLFRCFLVEVIKRPRGAAWQWRPIRGSRNSFFGCILWAGIRGKNLITHLFQGKWEMTWNDKNHNNSFGSGGFKISSRTAKQHWKNTCLFKPCISWPVCWVPPMYLPADIPTYLCTYRRLSDPPITRSIYQSIDSIDPV